MYKDGRDIGNPFAAALIRRVGDLKGLIHRVECNADPFPFVMVIQHFLPDNGGRHGSDALLSINENFFPNGNGAVFQFHVRILPDNNVTDRETFVQRIHQVTNLGGIPDKWTLHFRNGNRSGFDVGQKIVNGIVVHGVARHGQVPFPFSDM